MLDKKMKVVFFSTALTYSGGAIITLLNAMPFLQSMGVEPYFILKGHGSLEKTLKEKNIQFSVIGSYDWCVPEEKTKGANNILAWQIKRIVNIIAEIRTFILLKRIQPDIFHLNCIYNGTGVVSAKILKIPVVWHLREFVDIRGETTMFYDSKKTWNKINRADQIVCVSKYLEDFYLPRIKDQGKLKVVHDGINMSSFSSKRLKKQNHDTIIIGLAGTAMVKNHQDAIEAMSFVVASGESVCLRIAGRWPKDAYNSKYEDRLNEMIDDKGLKDFIEFVGMQDDMNKFWNECDISIVCSRRESFGLAATEAMACGVPLICSNTSISGELTDDRKNVSIYQTGNSRQLAICIMDYIRKLRKDELTNQVIKAERFVRESFSIDKSANELYKIFAGMVENR